LRCAAGKARETCVSQVKGNPPPLDCDRSMTRTAPAGPSRREAWRMFDRISRRYDLLNRLLSFGRDVSWRNRLASYLPQGTRVDLLDLATGTGDVLLTLRQRCNTIAAAVGLDLAPRMLQHARLKASRMNMQRDVYFARGDVSRLPFAAGSFDVVTIAFGIRNFISISETLQEIFRVLRPQGRLVILEFSLPTKAVLRACYMIYLRRIVPLIGWAVSGDSQAYRYLDETVETFPYGWAFREEMAKAGYVEVTACPLTFGVATIYAGYRP